MDRENARSGAWRADAAGYVVAVVATVVVWLAHRFIFDHSSAKPLPLIPFLLPIVVTGWYGGLRPALAAFACATFAVVLVIQAPLSGLPTATRLIMFTTMGGVLTWHFRSIEVERQRTAAEHQRLEQQILQRQQAEEALRQSEERLRTLSDNLPSGAIYQVLHLPDDTHRFSYISAGIEQLLGVTPQEVLRDPSTLYGLILDDDLPGMLASETESLKNLTPYDYEFRMRTRSGSVRWVNTRSAPRRLPGGETAWEGVLLDISARKEAEAIIRERDAQFELLADSIPQLAWMARPDGYIFWYNKRWFEYTGTTLAQMEGWGWQSVHDPAEVPRVVAGFQRALENVEPWEDTFPLRRHDGQMRWHLSRAMPLVDGQGRVVLWFGTNTDITDRMQMEEKLKDADRRKDEFLATLAHELRNPLAPISNALQLWPLVEKNPAEVESLRMMMERQVQHIIRLIDDLLDVSRITRGKISLRKKPTDVSTIIESAIDAVRPIVSANEQQLTIQLPQQPIYLEADVARLVQVVGNLLNNAAKYTGRQGQIWIAAEQQGDEVVIRVRDNGEGIPPQMLQRIFGMFVQVDATLHRAHGGLGIGLTLARSLVELHHGTLEAHSEGVGKGSEFIVRLPALREEALPKEVIAPMPRAVEVPPHRVLIVDDVVASAETLAMMLRAIGQEVQTVHDGLAAIEQAAAFQPDIVLLDIAMPGMDGYQVARTLRGMEALRDTVLVALTGYGQEEDRRQALDAGFHHHMTKPVNLELIEQLLLAVSSHREPTA